MNVLETQWWTLALPPEWWGEAEDESILVGDRDGVGCLEFSTLQKESGQFEQHDLQAILQEGVAPSAGWQSVKLGDFKGLFTHYEAEKSAVREWCVASGALALFITYSCELENLGMDDAAVDQILDTLCLIERQ